MHVIHHFKMLICLEVKTVLCRIGLKREMFIYHLFSVGFVDAFADNKEAVLNHGRKLLKVYCYNNNHSFSFFMLLWLQLFVVYEMSSGRYPENILPVTGG